MKNWEEQFNKKFPSWINTKFDLKTGEVEHKKDIKGKGASVVAERKELKQFIKDLMNTLLDELEMKEIEAEKIKISAKGDASLLEVVRLYQAEGHNSAVKENREKIKSLRELLK